MGPAGRGHGCFRTRAAIQFGILLSDFLFPRDWDSPSCSALGEGGYFFWKLFPEIQQSCDQRENKGMD